MVPNFPFSLYNLCHTQINCMHGVCAANRVKCLCWYFCSWSQQQSSSESWISWWFCSSLLPTRPALAELHNNSYLSTGTNSRDFYCCRLGFRQHKRTLLSCWSIITGLRCSLLEFLVYYQWIMKEQHAEMETAGPWNKFLLLRQKQEVQLKN